MRTVPLIQKGFRTLSRCSGAQTPDKETGEGTEAIRPADRQGLRLCEIEKVDHENRPADPHQDSPSYWQILCRQTSGRGIDFSATRS